jgi:hypothetical protein
LTLQYTALKSDSTVKQNTSPPPPLSLSLSLSLHKLGFAAVTTAKAENIVENKKF